MQFINTSYNVIINPDKLQDMRGDFINKLDLNKSDVPDDIKISTMTLEAKFKTTFYPWNIYKYIKRDKNSIINVIKGNYKKKEKHINTINEKTKHIRKGVNSKNKQSTVFLNQVTVSIKVDNKEKPVSVKIFNNGTVHFTGCIDINNLIEASYKLCIECKRPIAILNEDGKVVDINFVDNPDELSIDNIYDIKIDMINCIFVVPFKIDRSKLQILMKNDGYNVTYDSNRHAGVKISYVSVNKKITIFVFESGSVIIILGSQGFSRINEIYTFIYKYLLSNYDQIVKEDNTIINKILAKIEMENLVK
jgi:hypothetical protein